MDVNQYKEGIRKRRQERMHLLRKKKRTVLVNQTAKSATSSGPESFSSYMDKYETTSTSTKNPAAFTIKVLCSLIIAAGVYVVSHSDDPRYAQAQSFVQEAMHKEFNVQAVMAWYEEKTGGSLSFLPRVIRVDQNRDINQEDPYVVPVNSGQVVSNFGQDQQGIMVGTESTLPVEVIKDGWVIFVGEKEGLGQTVVIDHGDGEESWYGQIEDLQVQLYDWVSQGKEIGTTSVQADSGTGIFYFAMRKNDVFIDPLDVIRFD